MPLRSVVMSDALFATANHFYVGNFQTAINEGTDLTGLSEKDAVERDCFVYRSYLALGSHQVRRRHRARPAAPASPPACARQSEPRCAAVGERAAATRSPLPA